VLTDQLTYYDDFAADHCQRAITRNEAKYPNPEEFKPERFFGADGKLNDDTVSFAFGAGRRICQSR
jgi:cytochrome P450